MKFTDEHKKEINQYLPFGVSKVKILGFKVDKSTNGSDFIEVHFATDEGAEDHARLYFTDKATQFSFNTLRTIALHNTAESKREAARKAIDAVADHEALAELLEARLMNGEAWATKYYDPTRTYEKEGQTYRSINVNIFGYEPKINLDLMPKPKESVADAAAGVGFEEEKSDVPFNDDGSDPDKPATKKTDWA